MSEEAGNDDRRRRPGRAERSDSVRNRQKLISVAQAVFAEEGLNAPMDRIAARAGVGSGTLYRHFPSRLQLWAAVLEQPLITQLDLAQRALANPDRWAGVSEYILAACALEAERDGYLNLLSTRFDGVPDLLEIRRQIHRAVSKLISLAREEGAVRADFATEDLMFIALSNSKIAEMTRSTAPGAWRRNAEFFLEAIRPERAHPLTQRPMTPSQVNRSMTQPVLATVRTDGGAVTPGTND